MNLPMQAFCLNGYQGEKVVITIEEAISYPECTSYEGGYDVIGKLEIKAGGYHVVSERYIFATGALYRFLEQLQQCYKNLEGTAHYQMSLENQLVFRIEMSTGGHAVVIGSYQENLEVQNILQFEIETDQTCLGAVIQDIKEVEKVFGGNQGVKTITENRWIGLIKRGR